jgi:rod shape-determining protein MreC
VGRVVGVQDGISRVLLLTDVASRTPVMIDRNNARAILTGDGGGNPRLANMRSRDPPRVGDVLVTSGDGGVFPRGLPVGVVVRSVDGAWRAQLASDRAPIDYVRIIRFEDFTQLANEQALSAPVAPAQMGGTIPAPQPPAPTLKITPKVDPKAAPAPKAAQQPKAATPPAPKAAPPPAPKAAAPPEPKAPPRPVSNAPKGIPTPPPPPQKDGQ